MSDGDDQSEHHDDPVDSHDPLAVEGDTTTTGDNLAGSWNSEWRPVSGIDVNLTGSWRRQGAVAGRGACHRCHRRARFRG